MSTPKAYSYIRFSTPEQEKGDSLRRQEKAANDYAKDKGLDLISLRDMGISAHSGAHITKGELGEFIDWIKEGKVAKGSHLIIENIDRLTRLRPMEAERLFYDILTAGVTIVVVNEYAEEEDDEKYKEITEKTYDDKYYNEIKGEIRRAYRESKRKSKFGKTNWKQKRRELEQGTPLTRTCPQWLEPVEDDKGNWAPYKDEDGKLHYFEPKDGYHGDWDGYKKKEDVVSVIQLMFKMKAKGKGATRITNELNEMDNIYKPPNGWAKPTVNKYLRTKKVLGHFTAHIRDENDKREETDYTKEDYYPQIIDEELYKKAQAVFKENAKKKGNAGGQTGKENNLFRHIDMECAECTGDMFYRNHGRYSYIRCRNYKRNNGCQESGSISYKAVFEPIMLFHIKGLDVSDILPSNGQRESELVRAREKLRLINNELEELETAIENRDTAIDEAEKDDVENRRLIQRHNDKLKKLLKQEDEKKAEKEKLKAEINRLSKSSVTAKKQLKNIRQLIDHLNDAEEQERIDIRIQLRTKIQRLIDRMVIGFDEIPGAEIIFIDIHFEDGARQIMEIKNKKLDKVTTIEDGDIDDIQDFQKKRQKEANRRVRITKPGT